MASINASIVDNAIKLFKDAAWGIANHATAVEGKALNNLLHAELPSVAQKSATHLLDGIKLLRSAGLGDASDAVRLADSAVAQLKPLAALTAHPGPRLGDLTKAGTTIGDAIEHARPFANFMERVRPDYG